MESIPWYDTGRYKHVDDTAAIRRSRELLRHLRNQRRLAARPARGMVGDANYIKKVDTSLTPVIPDPLIP